MNDRSRKWLLSSNVYVVTKRFSAKEERRRIVAAIFEPRLVPCEFVAFENHLNYFHETGRGLSLNLAKGLTLYLNSGIVDACFRQFNGHTQVNASDLRSMRFPTRNELEALGRLINNHFPNREEIDRLVESGFRNGCRTGSSRVSVKSKVKEALEVLTALGMPREQLNERSALTVLSLLDLKPRALWSAADKPLVGITPMMEFFAKQYGKKYAPNSRETVRRFTVHQFEHAGLILKNPDKPRPINSPDCVYQIEAGALELIEDLRRTQME